eukprot:GEMP01104728.1.p1 GENE.GEMP01104728.1~~GEMP01104728.1.p1  ORF type:complete len:115 (+),score=13.01 GEMP01104728.1:285-629(+)
MYPAGRPSSTTKDNDNIVQKITYTIPVYGFYATLFSKRGGAKSAIVRSSREDDSDGEERTGGKGANREDWETREWEGEGREGWCGRPPSLYRIYCLLHFCCERSVSFTPEASRA